MQADTPSKPSSHLKSMSAIPLEPAVVERTAPLYL
jgi:hypothetical protein